MVSSVILVPAIRRVWWVSRAARAPRASQAFLKHGTLGARLAEQREAMDAAPADVLTELRSLNVLYHARHGP